MNARQLLILTLSTSVVVAGSIAFARVLPDDWDQRIPPGAVLTITSARSVNAATGDPMTGKCIDSPKTVGFDPGTSSYRFTARVPGAHVECSVYYRPRNNDELCSLAQGAHYRVRAVGQSFASSEERMLTLDFTRASAPEGYAPLDRLECTRKETSPGRSWVGEIRQAFGLGLRFSARLPRQTR